MGLDISGRELNMRNAKISEIKHTPPPFAGVPSAIYIITAHATVADVEIPRAMMMLRVMALGQLGRRYFEPKR